MPSSLDLEATLALATHVARSAGEIICRHYAVPTATTSKSSRIDIVTAADHEVEEHIVGALRAQFPDHHFVGEEDGGQGTPADQAAYHSFIDPVDGTVNFASKVAHFCTSIALATADREPQLGVIFDPIRNELFSALPGRGSRLNGRPIRVTATSELIDAVIASGFPYDRHTHPDNNLKEWAAMITRIRGERRFGSAALDFCRVAAGRFDGYWEMDIKPWDTMAGLLIAREAGGTVTDYRGNPRPQRRDRGRYVATNGRIHAAMLAVLQSVADPAIDR